MKTNTSRGRSNNQRTQGNEGNEGQRTHSLRSSFSSLPSVQKHRSLARRLNLERLEERTVLSGWVLDFPDNPAMAGSSNGATSIKADADGNMFVSGTFVGTVDFAAGPGTANLTSAGAQDIFVTKYAPDGNLLWAQRFGGASSDSVASAGTALDGSGNLYLTGWFRDTVSFGSTTLVSTSPSGEAFVARIDGPTGGVLWAQKMGGGSGVAVSPSGAELWVTGGFTGPATFGSFTLPGAGGQDAFAAKLDTATGAVLWAGQMGGSGTDYGMGIAVDSAGSAYLTGTLGGTAGAAADFDPGAGTFNVNYSAGQNDIFLARLDSAGGFGWAKAIGGSGGDYGKRIAVNAGGHIVLAADIGSPSIDFDPGPAVAAVTGTSAIAEFTANGDLVWAKGSEGYIQSLALGAGGEIYVSGAFYETADLDPGPGVVNLSAAGPGNSDGFVARLTPQGNATWIRRLGGALVDSSGHITVDALGNVLRTGTYGRGAGAGPGNAADFPTGDMLHGSGMSIMKLEQLPSGQLPFATITGKIFNDENQNGLDDDAPAPPPSTVYLDANNNGQLDPGETSTTPYANGMYTFNGLADGTYHVRQVLPAGWSRTTPAAVFDVTVNLSSSADQLFTGKNFGSYQINATKFYVVNDGSPDRTYEYRYDGGAIENYAINSGNSAPRGAASTIAGDKVWVVDSSKKVYVYNTSGGLLGSWTAGLIQGKTDVQGIATNGTDIWIVDAKFAVVYRFAGAASRLSGSQNYTSFFNLDSANSSPTDLVTDGGNMWVLNNSTTDKVFKYQVSYGAPVGATYLLGSWTITGGGGSPTGITIDPANESNVWIVDNATDRVYQFDAAVGRTSGSQSPSTSFALSAGNTNPQGIADPPAPVLGPAAASVASYDEALLSIVGELDGILAGKKRK